VTATETETHVFPILPLPSAAEFASFEIAVPGTGERILSLIEKQFEHRCELEITQQEQEAKKQENDSNLQIMGVVVGFLVIVIFAILAVIFALSGRQTEALAAIIAPMVAFAIAVLKYTTANKR